MKNLRELKVALMYNGTVVHGMIM